MMKKNYLWMAAMASLLSFTACSDDASPLDNSQAPGEVVMDDGTTIEISVSNTGIGTRAARPMGSSAAANNVDKVKLVFYKDNQGNWEAAPTNFKIIKVDGQNYQRTDNIINFTANGPTANGKNEDVPGTEGVPGYNNRIEEKVKIKMTGIEADAKYLVVAYGYNGNTFPYGTPAEDKTIKGLFSTADGHGKEGYDLEEVFAGKKEIQAGKADGKGVVKFKGAPSVTITRQVAGILAYFKIPTYANGELVHTVKVIANSKSTGFQFPASLLAKNNEFNGTGTTTEEDPLITFEMKDAAANWNGGKPEGEYYTTNTNKKGYATGYSAPTNLKLLENTFFGARYILPYDKHVKSQTLKVVMYGAKNKVLKTLKVVTKNIPTTPTDVQETDFAHNYDIRCNNFYSIGKKMASGNTEGKPDPENPDPENPDPDPQPDPKPEGPDEPIDLGATDQIVVQINDAWDVIHDMDVEEE